MSKKFSSILFSLFLLLQNSAIAEENETNGTQTEVIQEEQEVKETAEVEAPKEALSEAQKEAIAAEEAELREAGMEPEPRTE
jgi:hypothetical protein